MRRLGLGLALFILGFAALHPSPARGEDMRFTLVNLEYEGTKIWLPGTVVVPKGTKVTLKLINNAPSGQHGFAIPTFGVAEVVEKGTPKVVSFVADKAGIFQTFCQLHPAHVGNQIVVLDE